MSGKSSKDHKILHFISIFLLWFIQTTTAKTLYCVRLQNIFFLSFVYSHIIHCAFKRSQLESVFIIWCVKTLRIPWTSRTQMSTLLEKFPSFTIAIWYMVKCRSFLKLLDVLLKINHFPKQFLWLFIYFMLFFCPFSPFFNTVCLAAAVFVFRNFFLFSFLTQSYKLFLCSKATF